MKFESLQFFASHGGGWGSQELRFGKSVTQLFALNGSGKTPLIQSIMFCLGLDVQFREDIIRNTGKVVLRVNISSNSLSFERKVGEKYDITVSSDGRTINRFYNDEDFSRFMLGILNLR